MRRIGISIAVTAGLATSSAWATEDGNLAYPIGVNTIAAGIAPPPNETWLQNYSVYYYAPRFTNSQGTGSVPGFTAGVVVDAVRVFHGWNFAFGNFNFASAFVTTAAGYGIGDNLVPNGIKRGVALGDFTLQPLYLTYSNDAKTFFSYAGVDYFIPSETFISNKYVSIVPQALFTWIPTPDVSVSWNWGVQVNVENPTTHYLSGPVAFMDYGIDYHVSKALPNLTLGVNGFAEAQLGNDTQNGILVNGGNRQSAFAIGPQITYKLPVGAIAVKWQHEVYAQNRPKGDRYWFEFYIPFKPSRS